MIAWELLSSFSYKRQSGFCPRIICILWHILASSYALPKCTFFPPCVGSSPQSQSRWAFFFPHGSQFLDMDMFFPFPFYLPCFIFFPCSADDISEESAWVHQGTGGQPDTSSSLHAKGFCSGRASIYFIWARCRNFPWHCTWSPLCDPDWGLLESANQRQRGYELLCSVMQGGGIPPEMLWIMIPVTEKLIGKMTRTIPCLGHLLSAVVGPWGLWWHRVAPQAAGQVISQHWQNGTWQSATEICVRFVTYSTFYSSGGTPDCTARSQGLNRMKGIGRKCLSYDGFA